MLNRYLLTGLLIACPVAATKANPFSEAAKFAGNHKGLVLFMGSSAAFYGYALKEITKSAPTMTDRIVGGAIITAGLPLLAYCMDYVAGSYR